MAIDLVVQNYDDIQTYLDIAGENGGGTVTLRPGTYFPTDDLIIPTDTYIYGSAATIDFGGAAHQIIFEGTFVDNTGTVAINLGDTTVIGTGTNWDVTMEGKSILLGDFWYVIQTVNSPTDITIDTAFMGEDITGDIFVIAEVLSNVGLVNLNVENSTISLIKGRYVDGCTLDSVNASIGDIGFDFADCANIIMPSFSTFGCTTWGILFDNVPFAVLASFAVLQGGGVYLKRVPNTAIGPGSFQGITGVALAFENCHNIGLINYAIIGVSSHGVELVSGNYDVDLISGYYAQVGGDGMKLTTTTDGLTINNNSFKTVTGYGINIADANCDENIIIANSFDGGGAGAVNDSGTGTLIRSNIGVADN
jgi:hypothetical protein